MGLKLVLLAQPVTHVEDMTIRPVVADNYKDAQFNINLKLAGEQTGDVRIIVRDVDDNSLLDQTQPVAVNVDLNSIDLRTSTSGITMIHTSTSS